MSSEIVKTMVLLISLSIFGLLPIIYFFLKICLKLKRSQWKNKHKDSVSVGFFHPYCNAGGGGERVLWCAVRAIQNNYENVHCVIYTGDTVSADEILKNAKRAFNIELPKPIKVIHLKCRCLVEAKYYPYFTLLLQSLASVILGLEAAFKHVPDIYIDTMGYAFTYPVFKHICSCHVGAYVHYPTISTDMLSSVSAREVAVNNRRFISNSRLLSNAKLFYYRGFSSLYSLVGRQSEIIMVNSTWTQNHILELWKKPENTFIVYPPCDTSVFETLPLKGLEGDSTNIISIAQFRPEKNHKLQLEAFKAFIERVPAAKSHVKLILIGSCRHEEDYERVKDLKSLCSDLDIEKDVEFKVNLTFQELIEEMEKADVSIHSMKNEHFGIGIVECMSAGLIMIAHDSGGPKLDIVKDRENGFLAHDVKSYADALECVWVMKSEDILEMKNKARKSVTRFSVANFEESFLCAVSVLFSDTNKKEE